MSATLSAARLPSRRLALLVLLLAFAFLGSRGLWEPDEGRYALCARGMVTSGDWIWPRLDGELHLTKPPLTYWAIAGPVALFGPGEWAARLYLGLSFALTTLLVSSLGRRMWDRETGLAAGLVHVTTLLPFAAASVITPDTLLTLWEVLALYAGWRAWSADSPGGRRTWPAVTGLAFGLAFLTKGPPGLLFLPALYLFRRLPGGRREGAPPVLNGTGLAALLAIGLGWFAVILARRPDLLSWFLGSEVAGRMAGEHHRNSEWYGALVVYGPVFLLGGLPWNWTWLVAARRFAAAPGGFWRAVAGRPRALFLLLAVGLPLAVFVVARSRLAFYVLPLFAPLSLAAGRILSGRRGGPAIGWRFVLTWAALLLAIRFGVADWSGAPDARRLHRELGADAALPTLALERPSHHGLTWYAGQPVRRMAWTDEAGPPAVPGVAEILGEAAHDRRSRLILARDADAGRLLGELARVGFPCRRRELTGPLTGLVVEPLRP